MPQSKRPLLNDKYTGMFIPLALHDEIQQAAKEDGMSMSEWIRQACVIILEARRQQLDTQRASENE